MKHKMCIIVVVMAIFIFGISSVCAGDVNETIIASENDLEIDETIDGVIGAVEDTDLASNEENEILGAGEQSFTLLNETINGNTNENIYLKGNYKYSDSDGSFKKGIVIDRDVNIYGNGSIIDGSKQARIFNITGGNVVFYNITFINGNAGIWDDGGAIHGNCKVINCTFKQNQAQYGYGGAMYYGSAVDCTFTENQAYDGGGAMYKGSAVNSTFNLNSAGGSGGAMYKGSAVNCNFTENTATIDGGAMYYGSAVDCNFYGNAAGNYGNAMFLVYMWNCTDQDYDGYAMHLVLQWEANNFTTSYGSVEKLTIQLKNKDDFLVDFINYDVVIYKSEAYVKTYHCLSNDELSLDLLPGIYIAKLMVTYPGLDNTKPTNITLTVTDGTTFFDLNKTINDNTNNTITLDRDYVFNSTVDSAFTDGIVINRSVTINGNGYTIDAQGKARIFQIAAANVTVKNITFINAKASDNGGAILWKGGEGNVYNCCFVNNSAGYGGAIAWYICHNGNVSGCIFVNNSAESGGGAVLWTSGANGSVSACSFENNSAPYGGAVYWVSSVNGTVSGCVFVNNLANSRNRGASGGAIYFQSHNGLVSSCTFLNNTAGQYGGAIRWEGSNGNVSACSFENNSAKEYHGGAIYWYATGDDGAVSGCSFSNTSAGQYGGAVYWAGDRGKVFDCNFSNTSAGQYGGAIYWNFGNNGVVAYCSFLNTSANRDGGAIILNGNNNVVKNSLIENSYGENGGAIYIPGQKCSVYNITIRNSSATNGGAIFMGTNLGRGGHYGKIYNSTIDNCHATNDGGAVYLKGDYQDIVNSTFTNNVADRYGGAIFSNSNGNYINNSYMDGNNATFGSAIFKAGNNDAYINNVTFGANRANSTSLTINNEKRKFSTDFRGNDNILNAIWNNGSFNSIFIDGVNPVDGAGNSDGGKLLYEDRREFNQTITVSILDENDNVLYAESLKTGIYGEVNFTSYLGWKIQFSHPQDGFYTNISNSAQMPQLFVIAINETAYINQKVDIPVRVFDEFGDSVGEGTVSISVSGETFTAPANSTNVTITAPGTGGLYDLIVTYTDPYGLTLTNKTSLFVWDPKVDVTKKAVDPVVLVKNHALFEINVSNTGNRILSGVFVSEEEHSGLKFVDYSDHYEWAYSYISNKHTWTLNRDLNVGESVSLFVTFDTDSVGNFTNKIISGSAEASNKTAEANLTVKANSTLTINGDVVFDYGANGSTTVSFANAIGLVAEVIGQPKAIVNVTNNLITVSGLDVGNYTLSVTTVTDENHNNVTKTVKITVNKASTEITVNPASLELFVGDETVIFANLTPDGAGNVTFTSSNDTIVDVDNQGNVIAQGKGQAIITVSFAGDNNYAAAENRTITVTVSLDNASVTVVNDTLDLKIGETYAINATKHPDTIMLDITYTSSNNAVATVDGKGIVTAVGEGTAIITVEVGDGEIYAKNSTNVTVTVSKVPTEIDANSITATYNVNKDLVITLKDANGNTLTGVDVTVDLNGIKNYVTDVNGQVNVSTAGLAPKTYAAKITFAGNTKYLGSSADVKVTVNKATPKITAKKKTYKAKKKTKKFKITLKDNTGKPIKNAKVRLIVKKVVKKSKKKSSKKKSKSVKKKNYAKTNSKGKATFKVLKTKKGKYNAKVKFYGDQYYNKTTKTVKIVIK